MRKEVCILLLLILVPSVLAQTGLVARAPTPTEMTAALAKPGVMFIMTEVKIDYSYSTLDGDTIRSVEVTGSRGSGFAVRPNGYIITNAHVVTVDKEETRQNIINRISFGDYEFAGFLQQNLQVDNIQSTVRVQSGVVAPGQATAKESWPAEIKKIGAPYPGKDVAIIKVEQTNLPTVRLGDQDQLEVGSTVIAVGYPGAADVTPASQLEPSVTQGIVSAKKTAPAGWPLIQIDAAISPGSSGGPVFALDGTVVGIATLGSTETQGFNWIVPSSVIKEFMSELNIINQEGVIDKIYQTGLQYYWAGKHSKAITEFNKVLDLNPKHSFAKEFIAKSRKSIEIEGETFLTGKNIAMAVGVFLLVIVLFLLVYFLVKEEKVIKKEEKIIKKLGRKPAKKRR